ncbi:MAG: hypothetical protein NVS1B7_3210 [Candidatus Saccharimonadales bacterium]
MATIPSNNHYLQSEPWAIARDDSPWHSQLIHIANQPVFVYKRKTPIGLVIHIPGLEPKTDNVKDLTEIVKNKFSKAVVCKLETCGPNNEMLANELLQHGWQQGRTTQYAYTVQLDLTKSVDQLKIELKKRARNEINRAMKNDVLVKEQQITPYTLNTMYQLLTATAQRKQFGVHDKDFTLKYWQAMHEATRMRLFFATKGPDILAAAVILISHNGLKAWYKEGASTLLAPTLNAPRYLLWEIALQLKATGIELFDLSGIPDPATYEMSTMHGIYVFKTAYNNTITPMMPAYELPLNQWAYKLWPKTELLLRKLSQARRKNWY